MHESEETAKLAITREQSIILQSTKSKSKKMWLEAYRLLLTLHFNLEQL